MVNLGRPVIPCRCSTGVEQFAVIRLSRNVANHLPMKTEDTPAPFELCH